MDWPERQARYPGAASGVYWPAGAGPAAQAAKEVHTLWLSAELGLGPGSLRWREGTLLPSGEFPRIAVAVALLLAALLIADLLLFYERDSTPNLRPTADLTACSLTNLTEQRRAVEALREGEWFSEAGSSRSPARNRRPRPRCAP